MKELIVISLFSVIFFLSVINRAPLDRIVFNLSNPFV
jgi:hypothetical protein